MKKKTGKIKTRPWDRPPPVLGTAFEDGDPALIAAALGDIARAKGMSQIARETGLGRESLLQSAITRRQPGILHGAQGRARARPPLARSGRCLIIGSHGKRDWSESLARRDRQNPQRQGDAGAQESGSLDPREMSKGKDLTLQVQTRCLQHFTFASGDSKRW